MERSQQKVTLTTPRRAASALGIKPAALQDANAKAAAQKLTGFG
jgi:hypothetical protein